MSKRLLFIGLLASTFASGQTFKEYKQLADRVTIQLADGTLNLIPLMDGAIRVQFEKGGLKEEKELVLVNQLPTPSFKFSESDSKLQLTTSLITVLFDKKSGAIDFADNTGKLFLSERPGGRILIPDSVMGKPCFVAQQSFDSPENEYLFGLGQFQDGHYNIRNVSRKLIQVNSQIAIPFLYSSRGYGILWHQYGLTQYNPADSLVKLVKREATTDSDNKEMEVTTTSGTQKVSQRQSLYTGKFTLKNDAEYSIMLDLGDMDSRHWVIIDDIPVIDQSNLWLPPAVSKLVRLKAGEHKVQIVCRATNTPKLSWRVTGNETTFRSPHAKSLDYIVFYGKNTDEVVSTYRQLSGSVPMLPMWAYGFWQCRERYTSGKHLVETVEEFRKRNLPMDVIVQDWQYWGKHGWGVPKFDTTHYPNPDQFIKKLHNLNAHFSISVWENLDKNSGVAKEYLDKNLYIPDSKWIDIFNPVTQQTHWQALNKNLFSCGVDSWWMDATEPENDALTGKETFFGPGDFYRLVYPLYVSKAVYEGQRATDPEKRVTILTRSAFSGQQRYGTINWSGDIGWDWDAYKRQIVAGLNYSLTGMPYWTTDIGGFFRPGKTQYTDAKYHDILTRWFQWGAFSTIFRIHGYQTETEPWKYGELVEGNMRNMLNLRYRLMPYIYSEAWQISKNGSTMTRPLVMDFKDDTKAVQQSYQYMFGKSLLVAPVTEPEVSEWPVYLPQSAGWYNFWTGQRFKGGQTVKTASPLDKIPVYVKAGSIVPMGKFMQHVSEKSSDTLEIRIYAGTNATFNLYFDEGDNYNYEKGEYKIIPLVWSEQKRTLTVGNQVGNYKGSLKQHVFNVVLVAEGNGSGAGLTLKSKKIIYKGEKISLKIK